MGTGRSIYYDLPERSVDDTAIVEAIFAICEEFEFYGYRRVGAALRQPGSCREPQEDSSPHARTRSKREDQATVHCHDRQ